MSAAKRSRTSGRNSASEQATWRRRPGNPGGARSEAQKLGLDPDADAYGPQPWEAEGLSRAGRVIAFLESLPITGGILAGQTMRLLPGQRAFVEDVYGRDDVQIAVKSEPRGNGKTGLTAGLALCHLLGPEAQPRGEVYSASIDRSMAALMFAEMAAIILATPSFKARVNIQRFHKKIEVLWGDGIGSTYEALSADARRGHGVKPSLWIYDELAQAKDGDLLGNLRTALGKKPGSLGIVISTQAPEDDHPLSQLIDDGLSGADPTIVVHLTAAAADADPFDPEIIRAVNPALGVFLDESVVFAEAAQARRLPLHEQKFRNLRLNQRVRVAEDERLASAEDWRRGEREIDVAELEGRTCLAGLDLSIKQDLTALVLAFSDGDGGYDVVPFFWTPDGQLAARPPAEEERLRQWIHAGHVEVIRGPIVHKAVIAERLAALAQRFDIQAIAYDPWQMQEPQAQFGLELPWEKFGQGHTQVMAAAIRYTCELIATERLRHDGNPALTASVLNAAVIPDTSGNPKLDKSRARFGAARIDGAVALVMALGTASRLVGEHVAERLVFA